mmetsp:Transcript_1013/g.4335  ORF Transcript_1013/g.4335 Transcript_1013/m.4335 type:complete len:97 (+) Transcript_1013:401-691(+)
MRARVSTNPLLCSFHDKAHVLLDAFLCVRIVLVPQSDRQERDGALGTGGASIKTSWYSICTAIFADFISFVAARQHRQPPPRASSWCDKPMVPPGA